MNIIPIDTRDTRIFQVCSKEILESQTLIDISTVVYLVLLQLSNSRKGTSAFFARFLYCYCIRSLEYDIKQVYILITKSSD